MVGESMRRLPEFSIWGLSLVLSSLSLLYAQTLPTPAADSNAAANPAPASLAPDEMTKKITDLVHSGKYTEAQQLTTGLLVAYPNDQRLIKAKALIDKLLAPGGSASAAPVTNQPTQPVPNANAEQLTGMDKVDYDALIELGRQAQQNTDLEQQKVSLKQFMDQSGLFLQKHPDQILLWQLRAASAISLNDPMAGYEAGQKLLAAGVADSTDPNSRRLLAQLKNKGWLDREGAEKAKEHQRYISVTFAGEAANTATDGSLRTLLEPDITELLHSRFPQINSRINAPDDGDPPLRVTINVYGSQHTERNHEGWAHHMLYHVNSTLSVSVSSPKGLRVDRTFAVAIDKDIMYNTFHPLVEPADADFTKWIEQEVIARIKGVLDEDVVRKSLDNTTPNP